MPNYISKANFYLPHGEFMQGDKRMHHSTIIEAGTIFSSEETPQILGLISGGFIEVYRSPEATVLPIGADGGSSVSGESSSKRSKGDKSGG